jgi:phage terminase large subunit-like protein
MAIHTAHGFEHWSGDRPIGDLERLCYERQVRDLETGHERGLWFDEDAAGLVKDFFPKYLRLYEGEWFNKPFTLLPWQEFFLGCVFGWMKLPSGMTVADAEAISNADHPMDRVLERRAAGIYRRFHTGWCEVPKKNGKTPLCAGIAMLGLVADGEGGAQVATAAAAEKQAKLAWGGAKRFVLQSPVLRERVHPFHNTLVNESMNAKCFPMSGDSALEDGINLSMAIIDEIHRLPNDKLLELITMSVTSRQQPLIVKITTAGDGQPSVWLTERTDAENILNQVSEADDVMVYIAAADPDCAKDGSWEDEEVWAAANPSYGAILKPERVRDEFAKAKRSAASRPTFLRFRLNVPTLLEERWGDPQAWDACARHFTLEEMAGKTCWLGVDLSNRVDLTALVAVFPPLDGATRYRVWPWFWCPEDCIDERVRKDRVPYRMWEEAGHIAATPGNTVDYRFVRKQIVECCEMFDVEQICFDPWNAGNLVGDLQDEEGIDNLVEVRQGHKSLNSAMKELEVQVLAGGIEHPENPVLTWNYNNVVARLDENENVAPSKKKSKEKIDGVAALLNALAVIMGDEEGQAYSDHGLMVVDVSPDGGDA